MTKTYCISLKERTDRRENMNKFFKDLELCNNVEYILVDPHPDGGIYGCFESHMKIWDQVCKSYLPNNELIVIFEDDVIASMKVSSEDFRKLLEISSELLSFYDIIQFGRDTKEVYGQILEWKDWSFWYGRATFTHFYVITAGRIREHIDKIKRHFGKHIDHVFSKTLRQVLLYPNIFQQRDLFDTNIDWGSGDGYSRTISIIKNKYLDPYMYYIIPTLEYIIKRLF